jgi:hypothetical protein
LPHQQSKFTRSRNTFYLIRVLKHVVEYFTEFTFGYHTLVSPGGENVPIKRIRPVQAFAVIWKEVVLV